MPKCLVYFTKEITPESLIKIYEALGVELKSKVAVKISTGEPGGYYFLDPNLIKGLVNKLNGTIVECLTAYSGKRNTVKDHWQTFEDHDFKANAPCDLLDEEDTINLPTKDSKFFQGNDIAGSHIKNYNSSLILSHFKVHIRGGFGGALKNMSIGYASAVGKTSNVSEFWEKKFLPKTIFLKVW